MQITIQISLEDDAPEATIEIVRKRVSRLLERGDLGVTSKVVKVTAEYPSALAHPWEGASIDDTTFHRFVIEQLIKHGSLVFQGGDSGYLTGGTLVNYTTQVPFSFPTSLANPFPVIRLIQLIRALGVAGVLPYTYTFLASAKDLGCYMRDNGALAKYAKLHA